MKLRRFYFLLAFCLAVLVGASPMIAQTYPAGSCLIAEGVWCWPVEATVYGAPCQCPTPEGLVMGITQ